MKRFQEQLQSKANSVRMTAAERRDVKERLQAYMEYHPLPAELRTKTKQSKAETMVSEPFAVVQLPFGMMFKAVGAVFAMVLLVVPFVAERAVPGDSLYAVKVQFNEELRSTLTFDSTQKVEWETERLNRRIAEARLLANEGRLTDEMEAEVAAAVKEHTETAQKEIAQMREVDADDAAIAAIALDTTLEIQSSALKQEEDVDATSPETRSTSLLASVIDESRQNNPTVASTTPPSFEKLTARVEQNTTRIVELRDTVSAFAPVDRLAEVDRRIADVNRIIAEAVAAVEADDQGARQQLVEALQRSQKLIVFMTEIEMVETIDIETVVPIVLTDEEKVMKQDELRNELTDKRNEVSVILNGDGVDTDIAEKAVSSLDVIDEAIEELASSTAYLVFVERAVDAIQLADETIAMLGTSAVEEVEVPTVSETGSSTTEQASTTPANGAENEPATTTPAIPSEAGSTTEETVSSSTGTTQ